MAKETKSRRGGRKPPVIEAEAQEVAAAADQPLHADAGDATSTLSDAGEAEAGTQTAGQGAAADAANEPASVQFGGEAPRDVPPPDDRPPRPGNRYRTAAGVALVAVIAAVVGGWIYATFGGPGLDSQTDARLAALAERIDRIVGEQEAQTGRLAAVEAAIDDGKAEAARLASVVSSLEQRAAAADAANETARRRIDELSAAVDALRNAERPTGPDASQALQQLGELRAALDALAGRVAVIDQGGDLAALGERMTRVEQGLAALRQEAAEAKGEEQTASDLGRTYAALADRIADGTPYAAELEALAALAPAAAGIDALRAHAAAGAPTTAALKARLAEISAGLQPGAEAAAEEPASGDVWSVLSRWLATAVTVRSLDEPDWAAVVARAEAAMGREDLVGAIAVVEETANPPPALADWLADAKARRDVDAALDNLGSAVLRRLAGRS